MSDRPLICAFLKVRNELVREGNLYRVLQNLEQYCDAGVLCDDASTDGTREVLNAFVARKTIEEKQPWKILEVPPEQQDFRHELKWKQRMLEFVHEIQPHWVLWMDGDEVFDRVGTLGLRKFCEAALQRVERAWRVHYTQFWRNTAWARTDSQFDEGLFIKLWRWSPDLVFEQPEGTHHAQFPKQVNHWLGMGLVGRLPFEQLHYGNVGKNLVWKCIQYWGGLGGVDRHLRFAPATYRATKLEQFPPGVELIPGGLPEPFTPDEILRIEDFRNLKHLPGYFTVVIPAYNRAKWLSRALESVRHQTYERWVALVIDDGSTDETSALMRYYQDQDPRIFSLRFRDNRGGVAVNEVGMRLASEWTAWWTRLGSDDYWAPRKLELDSLALADYDACYGMYVVERDGQLAEACNGPRPGRAIRAALLTQGFACSWANCAIRTSVLDAIRVHYGTVCDLRLRNMEDFLINARVARLSRGWVWRGSVQGQIVINPDKELCQQIIGKGGLGVDALEAIWRASMDGASAMARHYVNDENLTRMLITKENALWAKERQHA